MQRLLGVRPYALSTLENYCREFDWQRRVQEFDASVAISLQESEVDSVTAMHRRQAQAGALAQRVALEGNEAYEGEQVLPRAEGSNALGGLLGRGAKLERLARGEATERPEIVVSVLTHIIEGVAAVFVRVNILQDSDQRAALFAREADHIVDAEIAKLVPPG